MDANDPPMSNIYSWQQDIWKRLIQRSNLSSYALLLKGRQGTGKFAFARNLAAALLCENPIGNDESCGICASCRWLTAGEHPNFYQIEPEALSGMSTEASSTSSTDETTKTKAKKKPSQLIGVDQIRALTDFVNLSAHQQGYKIILIHPAEAMNLAAANALLKKLEEPPSGVIFILVTHRVQQLLPTIRSRCQLITMPAPDVATAKDWLKQQGVDDPSVCLAAASFAPLSALAFNDPEYIAQHDLFLDQISAPEKLNAIELAEKMQRTDLSMVVSWQQKWCYDLLSFSTTGKVRYHSSQLIAIQTLAATVNTKALVTYSRSLLSTQQLSRHPLNARLFLEEMFLRYAMLLENQMT